MTTTAPVGELDARFSEPGTDALAWDEADRRLEESALFWLSTVRPDGRPHVTPLLAVWLDGALWFCTGADERKARNLARNAHCVLTTGTNALHEGLDVVVEGRAAREVDDAVLRRVADAYEEKYGSTWRFDVRDGAFHQGDHPVPAVVYSVTPVTVFGFGKGPSTQTRWRFPQEQPGG